MQYSNETGFDIVSKDSYFITKQTKLSGTKVLEGPRPTVLISVFVTLGSEIREMSGQVFSLSSRPLCRVPKQAWYSFYQPTEERLSGPCLTRSLNRSPVMGISSSNNTRKTVRMRSLLKLHLSENFLQTKGKNTKLTR
ncbi:hypothetical protein TNCV_3965621 [Trichonephila clavipes]|nr:hypothetical protein TNCV_3965621 [Trichonephila clavipes]